MERKVVCDLNLISVDFGREQPGQSGNTFRVTFRHFNGERTGAIDLYQSEAEHFAVELEAVAAFLRAALITHKKESLRRGKGRSLITGRKNGRPHVGTGHQQ
jgi:hypothetical protein